MLGVNFVIAYQKGVKHKKRLRTVAPKHSTTGFVLIWTNQAYVFARN